MKKNAASIHMVNCHFNTVDCQVSGWPNAIKLENSHSNRFINANLVSETVTKERDMENKTKTIGVDIEKGDNNSFEGAQILGYGNAVRINEGYSNRFHKASLVSTEALKIFLENSNINQRTEALKIFLEELDKRKSELNKEQFTELMKFGKEFFSENIEIRQHAPTLLETLSMQSIGTVIGNVIQVVASKILLSS
jgi:hypothetical protein